MRTNFINSIKIVKNQKMNGWNKALWIVLCFGILGIIFNILMYTKFAYNSDFSYATNLALEEMKQMKLYPDGWRYSTGFYVFSINLFCMPFLLFLKNEVLCRELGMILLCMLMVCVCYKTFYKHSKRMFLSIIILLFIPLTGVVHWYFYDGNYFNFAFMLMITLFFAERIMFGYQSRRRLLIYYIIYFVALLLFTNDGLRNQLTITIPLFLAVLLFSYKKTKEAIIEKKYLIFLCVTLLGSAFGYGIYRALLLTTGRVDTDSLNYAFVDSTQMIGNFWTYLANTYSLYGIDNAELLSVEGIQNVLNWFYCTISTFVIPVIVWKNLYKIKNEFIQLVIRFLAICNGLTVFMVIATNSSGNRLLLPVYFNNIIYMGCFVGFLSHDLYRKYEEIFLLCVIVIAVSNHVTYQIVQRDNDNLHFNGNIMSTLFDPSDSTGLAQFLEEYDLTYGYSDYFTSLRTASFTKGKVRMVAFNGSDPLDNDVDMISGNWYDVETHSGKCFVLVREETALPDKYYELADEILAFTANFNKSEVTFLNDSINYKILVFDKNIHLYDELTMNN